MPPLDRPGASLRYSRSGSGPPVLLIQAKYVEIADSGHGLPIHRPAETNALLAEHWMQAEATSAR